MGLLANCERQLALAGTQDDPAGRTSAQRQRAVAHCGLGDLQAVEDWLLAWDATLPPRPGRVEGNRRTIYRRAGRPLPE